MLCKYGTEAQKAQWIGPLIRAEMRGAYCITEAGAGSDVSGIKTTATKSGSGWLLTGSKLWIHNAPVADVAFVLARTDPQAGKRGMSIFIVDCHAAGVSRGPKEHKLGQRSSQVGELNFDNVAVPADGLLGVEGRGFHMMMSVLEKGRVGIAALAVGIIQAALEASIAQAKLRQQFGHAIAEFQAIQFLLADMAKDAEAARLLVRSAAMKMDAGVDAAMASSMAKCCAGDAAVAQASNAVQIFGGSGFIRGYEVERLYRDAKITQIYEGTNQIQRVIIARKLLE
jgi:alkylation response protein AidB-like acyl-CoA dehydrogenase